MNIEIRFKVPKANATGRLKMTFAKDCNPLSLFERVKNECDYNQLAKDSNLPDGYEIAKVEVVLLDGRKIIKRKPLRNNASNS